MGTTRVMKVHAATSSRHMKTARARRAATGRRADSHRECKLTLGKRVRIRRTRLV